MRTPIIELVGVTKRFGSFVANDAINLTIKSGEIHAIVGENGAGKSTLMKILSGVHKPEEGRILLRGQEVELNNPETAMGHGIAMVYQHFSLAESLSVAENVVISNPPRRAGVFLRRKAEVLTAELAATYGFAVSPRQRVADCRVGVQQRVEILKALYRNPDVLILDEPTAVLTPQETHFLIDNLKKLRASGKTIIFITHKLKEVMAIADRVTVMRGGKAFASIDVSQTNPSALATAMVERELQTKSDREHLTPGEALLCLEAVSSEGDASRAVPVSDISLTLRKGEILGIAGVEGNGQCELIEIITGMRPVSSGKITIGGRDVTKVLSPAVAREEGLAHIPENRISTGLASSATLMDNLIMGAHNAAPIARGFWMNMVAARTYASGLVRTFDVRPGNITAEAASLSGGNMQKAIIARELGRMPQIIVAAHPTRGVDIGSAEFIYSQLIDRLKEAGVVLISSDLDEILRLSDRILVMYQGRIMAEALPRKLSAESLGLLMAGIKRDASDGESLS